MNDYLIYLCLPPYLAQWYAHECNQVHNRDKATCPREIYRFPTPVVPVRGSQESGVVPRIGLEHLADTIRNRFQVELFDDIHEARRITPKTRIDLLVMAWMEDHCIEDDDTNFRTLLKIYQRRRDAYRKTVKSKKS